METDPLTLRVGELGSFVESHERRLSDLEAQIREINPALRPVSRLIDADEYFGKPLSVYGTPPAPPEEIREAPAGWLRNDYPGIDGERHWNFPSAEGVVHTLVHPDPAIYTPEVLAKATPILPEEGKETDSYFSNALGRWIPWNAGAWAERDAFAWVRPLATAEVAPVDAEHPPEGYRLAVVGERRLPGYRIYRRFDGVWIPGNEVGDSILATERCAIANPVAIPLDPPSEESEPEWMQAGLTPQQMWDEIQLIRKLVDDDGAHGSPSDAVARKLGAQDNPRAEVEEFGPENTERDLRMLVEKSPTKHLHITTNDVADMLTLVDRHKAGVERLENALADVAAFAHCGGWLNIGEFACSNAIRRLTLPYWKKAESKDDTIRRTRALLFGVTP